MRRASRAEAVWLEELGPEARARKASLLSAWVEAAEGLRSAIHAHESERGPLVEALFPVWRAPSLRRHADQALAAEKELQRRLSSAYVVRRLAELATHSAVGPALETVAAAGAAWAAERDRPALSGTEADEVRARLLAVAGKGAHLLERVRWVSRAALTRRPDLLETVFPKRARAESPGEGESTEHARTSSAEPAEVAVELPAHVASDAAPQDGAPQEGTARDSEAVALHAGRKKRRQGAGAAAPPHLTPRAASATTDPPHAPTEHGTSSRPRRSGQAVTPHAPGEHSPRPSRRRASAENAPAAHDARSDSRPRRFGQAVTPDAGEHSPRPSRRRASAGNAPAAHDARSDLRPRRSGLTVTPDAGEHSPRPSRRRASAENPPGAHGARPDSRPRRSGQSVTPDAPGEHGTPRPSRRRASAENASIAQAARPTSRRRPSAPPDASRPEPRAPDGEARRKSRPARKS